MTHTKLKKNSSEVMDILFGGPEAFSVAP